MGSSTVQLQSVVNLMKTMGSLSVQQSAGGYSQLTWLAIANDVMRDLVSQAFNWKWNSLKVPPFYTISWQNDYASINQTGIGWLEGAAWIDINNTAYPKPEYPMEAKRGLVTTSFSASPPAKIDWLYNRVLKQGQWPGAGVTYTQPLGAVSTPSNPRTNILDANGNILVLTTYGVTGSTAPVAAAGAMPPTTVADGTCVWSVANPNAQGFRITPMPPQSGVVYKIEPIAQAIVPRITSLLVNIDPIPDDYAASFESGMYTYCHKYSNDPALKRDFLPMKQAWLADLMSALRQGDREEDNAGFVPDRSSTAGYDCGDVGPANPYGGGWPWNGGR